MSDELLLLAPEFQTEYMPPVEHFVHGGMYFRATSVIQGTFVEGVEHNEDSIAILVKGTIIQVDGDKRYKISAPYYIKTKAGSARKAFALTDVTYVTITPTDEETPNGAEETLYDDKAATRLARESYNKLLLEDKSFKKQEQSKQLAPFDMSLMDGIYLDSSGIDGIGVFAEQIYFPEQEIGCAYKDGMNTLIGQYINHSHISNATIVKKDDTYVLVAKKLIPPNSEIMLNYKERNVWQFLQLQRGWL